MNGSRQRSVSWEEQITNGINLVERKNAESKKCRKKNIESATNATSMNPFTKTA